MVEIERKAARFRPVQFVAASWGKSHILQSFSGSQILQPLADPSGSHFAMTSHEKGVFVAFLPKPCI